MAARSAHPDERSVRSARDVRDVRRRAPRAVDAGGRGVSPRRAGGRHDRAFAAPRDDFQIRTRGARSMCWRPLRDMPHPRATPLHLDQQSLRRAGGRRRSSLEWRTAILPTRPRGAQRRHQRAAPARFPQSRTAAPKAQPISTCSTTARSYELRTVVFRHELHLRPHQLGTEDQGWVAHFLRAGRVGVSRSRSTVTRAPGSGPACHVDRSSIDFRLAMRASHELARRVFNMGGGRGQHAQYPQELSGSRRMNAIAWP